MARTRRRRAGSVPVRDHEAPLNIDLIVEAALGLLDQVGLNGLTMRGLAERLDIQAASLYWYVRDKHELLGLPAETICTEMRQPDPRTPWREQLESLMGEYRRVLLAHRDAATILAATPPVGLHRLRLVDLTLGAIRAAGFEEWVAARAGRLVVDYTTGFVQEEYITVSRPVPATADHSPGKTAVHLPTLVEATAQTFPNIATLGPYLVDDDGEARFAFGLSVVLDGLEQRRGH